MSKHDLKERTRKFAGDCLGLIKGTKPSFYNRNILEQLLRSSSGVGANYCELHDAVSRKDFLHKLYICRKEVSESEYWLDLLNKESKQVGVVGLLIEAKELRLIFSTLILKTREYL